MVDPDVARQLAQLRDDITQLRAALGARTTAGVAQQMAAIRSGIAVIESGRPWQHTAVPPGSSGLIRWRPAAGGYTELQVILDWDPAVTTTVRLCTLPRSVAPAATWRDSNGMSVTAAGVVSFTPDVSAAEISGTWLIPLR